MRDSAGYNCNIVGLSCVVHVYMSLPSVRNRFHGIVVRAYPVRKGQAMVVGSVPGWVIQKI